MTRAWLICVFALALGCSKTTTTSPTAPTTPTTPTPSPAPAPAGASWIAEGTRLTNADVGFSGVLADTSTIQLRDGRWRMFFFAGNRYRSAISPDGLFFTVEAGARLPEGDGHVRVLRLSDGRVRAYFISHGGISSGVSDDEGLTFTDEGERVSGGAAGAAQLSGCSIVRTNDGRWRMYFSDLPLPGAGVGVLRIFSAVSTDLLSWSVDSGVRIGTGATLSGSGEHPGAVANTDGSISLFYFRNSSLGFLTSTAADGLTFSSETSVGISQVNDPDMIPLGNGAVRMYYNWGTDTGGTVSSAIRAAGSTTFRFETPSTRVSSPYGVAAPFDSRPPSVLRAVR